MNYLIVAFVVVIALLGWDDNNVRDKNAVLLQDQGIYKTQVDQLQGNVKSLGDTIASNNIKIDGLVTEATKREKVVAAKVDAAKVAAKGNEQLANFLLASKPNQPDICKATEDLINGYIDDRSKK